MEIAESAGNKGDDIKGWKSGDIDSCDTFPVAAKK